MAILTGHRAALATLLPIAALVALVAGRADGGEAAAKEYQVKAAFLLNFARFVRWPAEADDGRPLRIGVLGRDPFGRALDDTVRGETVRKHPLIVQRSQNPDDLGACDVVFIASSEQPRLDEDLAAFDDKPILLVGDDEAFARHGGVIAFLMEDRKVRFAISPANAARRRLKLDPQLLGLGRVVDTPQRQEP